MALTADPVEISLPPLDPALAPLGQLLVAAGFISNDELDRALAFQRQFGGRLGGVLVRMGTLSEERLLDTLSRQLAMPVATPDRIPGNAAPFQALIEESGLPIDWWLDQAVLAWTDDERTVNVIARDPLSPIVQEVISQAFGTREVTWWLTANQELDKALHLVRQVQERLEAKSGLDDVAHLRELAEGAPIVELVSNMFAQAFNEGASDIHVEPEERFFHFRFRIDGILHTRLTLPRDRFDAVASRVKLISGIDIAERRLPQDGRLSLRLSGEEIDVRVSCLPGVWGESIVLRLLPKERKAFRLDKIGMEADTLALFHRVVAEPHGVVLVTGPTGSGKSTTLYATLEAINNGEDKIITVEDPVEYNVKGVSQVQVLSEIGYTFARALRSILRQDPDIIMIGEIRDLETAEIAIQASLTGHLVFSTLHTNDSLSAFTRLINMGVEPFLVASALTAVQAQRLVRGLCPQCSEPEPMPPTARAIVDDLRRRFPHFFQSAPNFRKPVGCRACQGSGYRGRLGVYELAAVSPALSEAIMRQATPPELLKIARGEGFRTLREDGIIKAWRGETTVAEVLRMTGLGEGQGDEAEG